MKNLLGRQYLGRAVLLFCLMASTALADVVTLTLTGLSGRYGGEYTSPYTFKVNGGPTELLLACLDLERRVDWSPRTYQVYNNEGPDWSAVHPPPNHSTKEMYDAAAILTKKMLASAGSPDSIQGQYAWAIWRIFQGDAIAPVSAEEQGIIQHYYDGAMADAANNYGIPTYTVYMPLLPDGSPNYAGQRFIGVPDGGVTLMLLGGVLVGLETLRRRSRA